MNEPVYNCGCFWWMHGTEDACDLYLPERKRAHRGCPLVAAYRDSQLRQLAARRAAEVEATARFNMQLSAPERNLTATGASMSASLAYQEYLVAAYTAQANQPAARGLISGLLAAFGRR